MQAHSIFQLCAAKFRGCEKKSEDNLYFLILPLNYLKIKDCIYHYTANIIKICRNMSKSKKYLIMPKRRAVLCVNLFYQHREQSHVLFSSLNYNFSLKTGIFYGFLYLIIFNINCTIFIEVLK